MANFYFFESPEKLILGLLSGLIFGFLLQKGQVAKHHNVLGTFLLKDFTAAKIIATAILVGSIGVFTLVSMGQVELIIKPFLVGGVILGGVLFAIGMVVFGYCPGTSVAASAEGHRDAWVGVAGMFFGAGVFVAFYSQIEPILKWGGDYGKITFPEISSTSPWLWLTGLASILILAYFISERKFPYSQRGGKTSSFKGSAYSR